MTLATLNPWQVLDQFHKEAINQSARKRWHPAADISESDNAYTVSLDLPGLLPSSISLEINDQKLHIKGGREADSPENSKLHYSERVFGQFNRVFRLPKDADESAISANFEHGVLHVEIPKAAESKPRKVTINVS